MPYVVEIKTGGEAKNVSGVVLSIYGSKTLIEKMLMRENTAKTTPFEKNKLDEFEFYGVDVGEVGISNVPKQKQQNFFLFHSPKNLSLFLN